MIDAATPVKLTEPGKGIVEYRGPMDEIKRGDIVEVKTPYAIGKYRIYYILRRKGKIFLTEVK